MSKEDEGTLFRPDPKMNYPGARGMSPAALAASDDDEPQVALTERFVEAARSAKRRKRQTILIAMLCFALTAVASVFAPRQYEVGSEILVAKTQGLAGGQNQGGGWFSPEEDKKLAKEFEKQIQSRDNIVSIIRQTNLVERWDSMRQPHRRLLDKLDAQLGKPAPTDEQKFEALVHKLEANFHVFVDATTVGLGVTWSDPEAARDIVAAAVKNFQEARFASEVGVLPEQLKILEASAADAQASVASLAAELQARQALTDKDAAKLRASGIVPVPGAVLPADADPALVRRLEQVRAEKGPLEEAKRQRLLDLNHQLTEMQTSLAPGHPSVVALKATISATQSDSPQLAALKEQEKKVLAEIEADRARKADEAKNRTAAQQKAALAAQQQQQQPKVVEKPVAQKSVQDLQAQFDSAKAKYEGVMLKLETARIETKTAEAAFTHRYQVTRPAEVPMGPKRPVGLIAIGIGLVVTVLMCLLAAGLADRMSGIFFEPRDVRDRLGIPVFATFT